MENYIVSARKYRPSTFKSVVGQHALVNTLKNAVISGRLAHSYLFCGQRGVGKTTMARIFAKAINCEHLTAEGEPCNECESCRAFNEQRSLNIIELDAASNNSVEDIRQLTDQVLIPPVSGRYRVFIVDEVHMLSTAAFNAFLKTLEEPPAYVIFILATTERQKILPTILSRCQKYDFQRITPSDIAEQLRYVAEQEGYTAEAEALNVIAQKADGAMRDALSIFDQVAASSSGNITYQDAIDNLNILDYDYYFRLVDAFIESNVERSLLIYKEVRDHGFDSKVFVNGLASHMRELVVSHSPELAALLEVTGDIAQRYRDQSAKCRLNLLYSAMDLCNTCDLNYINATNKQFLVELTLIKICQLFGDNGTSPQPQQTLKKLENTRQPATGSTGQQTKAAPATVSAPTVAPSPSSPPKQYSQTRQPVAPKPVIAGNPNIKDIPSISIKNTLAGLSNNVKEQAVQYEKKESAAGTFQQTASRSNPYSEEDFQEAWREFIHSHPEEVILTKAMQTGFPKMNAANEFYLEVENNAQIEKFEQKKSDLLNALRDRLKNDYINLHISLRKANENDKVWTNKDLLVDIVKRNPKTKDFIEKYHLGFA